MCALDAGAAAATVERGHVDLPLQCARLGALRRERGDARPAGPAKDEQACDGHDPSELSSFVVAVRRGRRGYVADQPVCLAARQGRVCVLPRAAPVVVLRLGRVLAPPLLDEALRYMPRKLLPHPRSGPELAVRHELHGNVRRCRRLRLQLLAVRDGRRQIAARVARVRARPGKPAVQTPRGGGGAMKAPTEHVVSGRVPVYFAQQNAARVADIATAVAPTRMKSSSRKK